jgi:hypothetical protein
MNLYYFHIRNGHFEDVGSRLADIGAAKPEAMKVAKELIGTTSSSPWATAPWRLWVTEGPNGEGKTLLTLDVIAGGLIGTSYTNLHWMARGRPTLSCMTKRPVPAPAPSG